MTRTTGNQRLCGRRKCRNDFEALKAHFALGRYQAPSGGNLAQKTPDFIGPKQPLNPDRPWRVVAGPALGDAELRLATVARVFGIRRRWRVLGGRQSCRTLGGRWPSEAPHASLATAFLISQRSLE